MTQPRGETERGQLIAAIIGAIAVIIAALIGVRFFANEPSGTLTTTPVASPTTTSTHTPTLVPTAIPQPTAISTAQLLTPEPTEEPLPTVVSPTPATPTSTETPSPEAKTACREWDLASDFQIYPRQQNPNDDSCGNQDVWYFMGSTNRERVPSNYYLLRGFNEAHGGYIGLLRWHDINAPYSGVYFNAIEPQPQPRWPSKTVKVHTDSSRLIIIGWRSSIQGEVKFSGSVTDADPSCGDGINWYVTRNNVELAAGGFENSGAQDFKNGLGGDSLSAISVNEGDYIYLAFDPKGGDNCDSTLVYVTISMH